MDTDQIAERVAGAVARALVTAGRSQRWASSVSGIPYTTIGRKLRGQSEFTFTELKRIADALGVPASAFTPSEFAGSARPVTTHTAA